MFPDFLDPSVVYILYVTRVGLHLYPRVLIICILVFFLHVECLLVDIICLVSREVGCEAV
jgi:hypothetical protein